MTWCRHVIAVMGWWNFAAGQMELRVRQWLNWCETEWNDVPLVIIEVERRFTTLFDLRSTSKVKGSGTPLHYFSKLSCPGQRVWKMTDVHKKIWKRGGTSFHYYFSKFSCPGQGVWKWPTCEKKFWKWDTVPRLLFYILITDRSLTFGI